MSNVKNYTEQGGERLVIGGILEFTNDAKIINMPGLKELLENAGNNSEYADGNEEQF